MYLDYSGAKQFGKIGWSYNNTNWSYADIEELIHIYEERLAERARNPKIDEMTQEKSVLDIAIEKYGKEAQTVVAIEELSELQKELCKKLRVENRSNEGIVEELADVEIMLEQVRKMYNVKEIDVQKIKRYKLARLEWRLNELSD